VDANGQPYVPLITGQFSSGEFDCCANGKICWMASCCPCFTFAGIITRAQISSPGNKSMSFNIALRTWITLFFLMVALLLVGTKLHRDEAKSDEGKKNGQEMLFVFGFVVLPMFLGLISDLRTKFRAKFSIPGSTGADCMRGWFCGCCVLAQMDRHLALNDNKCSWSDQGPHPGLAALEAGEQPLQPQAV
jgi:Cys-rich protein (TIGR01571 family)